MEENNRMIVTDDSGQETEVEIVCTFESPDHRSFVLFRNPLEEDSVYAYTYDEDGNLMEVEDPDDWEMCEEVLDAYQDGMSDE